MIAAAARTSGTRAPVSSVLKRGVIAVCRARMRVCSRARAAALALARRALRALDELAEYVVFLAVVFLAVADDFCCALGAPWTGAGSTRATPSTKVQMRAKFMGRIKRTNPPSRYRLAGGNRVR